MKTKNIIIILTIVMGLIVISCYEDDKAGSSTSNDATSEEKGLDTSKEKDGISSHEKDIISSLTKEKITAIKASGSGTYSAPNLKNMPIIFQHNYSDSLKKTRIKISDGFLNSLIIDALTENDTYLKANIPYQGKVLEGDMDDIIDVDKSAIGPPSDIMNLTRFKFIDENAKINSTNVSYENDILIIKLDYEKYKDTIYFDTETEVVEKIVREAYNAIIIFEFDEYNVVDDISFPSVINITSEVNKDKYKIKLNYRDVKLNNMVKFTSSDFTVD